MAGPMALKLDREGKGTHNSIENAMITILGD